MALIPKKRSHKKNKSHTSSSNSSSQNNLNNLNKSHLSHLNQPNSNSLNISSSNSNSINSQLSVNSLIVDHTAALLGNADITNSLNNITKEHKLKQQTKGQGSNSMKDSSNSHHKKTKRIKTEDSKATVKQQTATDHDQSSPECQPLLWQIPVICYFTWQFKDVFTTQELLVSDFSDNSVPKKSNLNSRLTEKKIENFVYDLLSGIFSLKSRLSCPKKASKLLNYLYQSEIWERHEFDLGFLDFGSKTNATKQHQLLQARGYVAEVLEENRERSRKDTKNNNKDVPKSFKELLINIRRHHYDKAPKLPPKPSKSRPDFGSTSSKQLEQYYTWHFDSLTKNKQSSEPYSLTLSQRLNILDRLCSFRLQCYDLDPKQSTKASKETFKKLSNQVIRMYSRRVPNFVGTDNKNRKIWFFENDAYLYSEIAKVGKLNSTSSCYLSNSLSPIRHLSWLYLILPLPDFNIFPELIYDIDPDLSVAEIINQPENLKAYVSAVTENSNFSIICENYEDWAGKIYENSSSSMYNFKGKKNLINILNKSFFNYIEKMEKNGLLKKREKDRNVRKELDRIGSANENEFDNIASHYLTTENGHANIFEFACQLTDNFESCRSRTNSESQGQMSDSGNNSPKEDDFVPMFSSSRIQKLISYMADKNRKPQRQIERNTQTTNLLSLSVLDCVESKFSLSMSQLESGETISSTKFYKKAKEISNQEEKGVKSERERQQTEDPKEFRKILRKALSVILEHPESWLFRQRVDANNSPDYFKIIKTPIDLRSIDINIDKDLYKNETDFIEDVKRVFQNSRAFNGLDSDYWDTTLRLEKIFLGCIKEDWEVPELRSTVTNSTTRTNSDDKLKLQDTFSKLTLTQTYKIIDSNRPSIVSSLNNSLNASPIRPKSGTSINMNTSSDQNQKLISPNSINLQVNSTSQSKDDLKQIRKQKLAQIAKRESSQGRKHNYSGGSGGNSNKPQENRENEETNPNVHLDSLPLKKQRRYHEKKTKEQMEKERIDKMEKMKQRKKQQQQQELEKAQEKERETKEKESKRKELEKQRQDREERERDEKIRLEKEKVLKQQKEKEERELKEKIRVDEIKFGLMQSSPGEDFSPRKSGLLSNMSNNSPAVIWWVGFFFLVDFYRMKYRQNTDRKIRKMPRWGRGVFCGTHKYMERPCKRWR